MYSRFSEIAKLKKTILEAYVVDACAKAWVFTCIRIVGVWRYLENHTRGIHAYCMPKIKSYLSTNNQNLTSMKKVLFTSLCVATLMSCGQKQGPSEKEIQERIDAAVAAALESKQAGETSSSATTESMTTSSSATKSETPTSAFGTYEFSDNFNTWALTLNDDETCTIVNKSKGGEVVAYGSWNHWTYNEKISAMYKCKFNDKVPQVWFEGEGDFYSLSYPVIDVKTMYVYKNESAWEAKNPQLRLKATKTK